MRESLAAVRKQVILVEISSPCCLLYLFTYVSHSVISVIRFDKPPSVKDNMNRLNVGKS